MIMAKGGVLAAGKTSDNELLLLTEMREHLPEFHTGFFTNRDLQFQVSITRVQRGQLLL